VSHGLQEGVEIAEMGKVIARECVAHDVLVPLLQAGALVVSSVLVGKVAWADSAAAVCAVDLEPFEEIVGDVDVTMFPGLRSGAWHVDVPFLEVDVFPFQALELLWPNAAKGAEQVVWQDLVGADSQELANLLVREDWLLGRSDLDRIEFENGILRGVVASDRPIVERFQHRHELAPPEVSRTFLAKSRLDVARCDVAEQPALEVGRELSEDMVVIVFCSLSPVGFGGSELVGCFAELAAGGAFLLMIQVEPDGVVNGRAKFLKLGMVALLHAGEKIDRIPKAGSEWFECGSEIRAAFFPCRNASQFTDSRFSLAFRGVVAAFALTLF